MINHQCDRVRNWSPYSPSSVSAFQGEVPSGNEEIRQNGKKLNFSIFIFNNLRNTFCGTMEHTYCCISVEVLNIL